LISSSAGSIFSISTLSAPIWDGVSALASLASLAPIVGASAVGIVAAVWDGAGARGALRTTAVSFPPKAKELQRTCRSGRADKLAVGLMQSGAASSGDQPRLAGMRPRSMASRQMAVSMAPAAEVACPVSGLVDDVGGSASPKTARSAVDSAASLFEVPVPCALI